MTRDDYAHLLMRAGVGFAFLYPPIDALFDPSTWLGYFPPFMHGIIPAMLLLHSFGVLEVIIALWIISGKHILVPSIIATLMLITIVLFNLPDFQIVFRDISIATLSGALAMGAYRRKKTVI